MHTLIKYTFLAIVSFTFINLTGQSYSELYFQATGSPMSPKVQVSWNHYHTNAGLEKIQGDSQSLSQFS